jgi:hypothetical protein
MYSTILSRQGNKAAQVFCDGSGWGKAFPMKKYKEAHEALSLLFHRDGVPNVNSKASSEENYVTQDVTAGKLNLTLNHPI